MGRGTAGVEDVRICREGGMDTISRRWGLGSLDWLLLAERKAAWVMVEE